MSGRVFSIVLIESRSGYVAFQVTGKDSRRLFANESGGHRWQRIPPTEKRGRVQTSTVTVAVLPEVKEYQLHLDERDIEWQTCRGSGAGGQHRNKTESAVQMTHIPTGLRVRVENERSQHSNRALAMEILRARVYELKNNAAIASRADDRRIQIGSGMRGDKRFTIAVQRDQVTDHVTGKQISYKSYSRGNWEGFHD